MCVYLCVSVASGKRCVSRVVVLTGGGAIRDEVPYSVNVYVMVKEYCVAGEENCI